MAYTGLSNTQWRQRQSLGYRHVAVFKELGRVLTCDLKHGAVFETDLSTRESRVFATGSDDVSFKFVNYLLTGPSDEIYVTTFPEPGARLQLSTKGGSSPVWAPDGSTLYYFEGRSLMAVSVETEPRFKVTGREILFEGEYVQYRWSRQYDITPDGKHFILVRNPAQENIEVVTNWFDELRAPEN